MTEPCSWQDKRGNDCARPAAWCLAATQGYTAREVETVYACNVHLGDVVRERAVEWVGCWVDKA
jgi:hypothetical protein